MKTTINDKLQSPIPIQTVLDQCQREMCDISSGSQKKNDRKLKKISVWGMVSGK
jgi:hypothetical protein